MPYPIHLGITEAGTKWSGSLKSSVGLGTLLADGVGDTIRISLSTFHAEEEVKVAWEILKALQLRERGPVLIACPTCGRLQFDMDTVVAEIETRLEAYTEPIEVAVLGCAVNGIGEASHADFGITGAKNEGLIFAHGKPLRKVPQDDLVDALFEEIDKSLDRGKVEVDEAKAAEGADWLAKIEEENAGELTPERIAADGEGGRRRRRGRRHHRARARGRGALPEAGQEEAASWTRRPRRRRAAASPGPRAEASRDASTSAPRWPRSTGDYSRKPCSRAWTRSVLAVGTFRTTGSGTKFGISKLQVGALAYGAAHALGKKPAGGLPSSFLLAVTPKGLHAFKYKKKRNGVEAKEEVAAWDRKGLKVSTADMQTTTRVTLEWPDGEKIVFDQDGMGDNPWADEVVEG